MRVMERLLNQFTRKRDAAGFVGVPSHEVRRSIQRDDYSCGAHALKSVLLHLGLAVPSMRQLKYLLGTNMESGTAGDAIVTYLRMRDVQANAEPKLPVKKMRELLARGYVIIADVDGDHYALVHGMDQRTVHIADPSLTRCPARQQPLRTFRERFGRSGIAIRARALK